MPLNPVMLEQAIKAAIDPALANKLKSDLDALYGKGAGPVDKNRKEVADLYSKDIAEFVAKAVATEVINHILQNIMVMVPPGVPVATAGSPAAQVGATTAPAQAIVT